MLAKRSVLLAKEEVNYGVDVVPDGTNNAFLAIDAKIKEVSEAVERGVQQVSLSKKPSVLGIISVEVTFKIELRGSSTKGTAARVGDLLEACGFSETVSAGSSVTYVPASSTIKSVTLYLYLDGRRHIVTGAKGNVKATAPAGKTVLLEFSMKGIYAAPTTTALPTVTHETTIPPVVKSASLTLNAVTSLVVQQLELDMGNEVSPRPDMNSANGVAGFEITDRKPIAVINPESVLIATYDFRADLLATPRQLSAVIGSASGNKITFTMPKFNIIDIEYGDREGTLIETFKGECCQNADAGNDEVSIKFE